MKSNSIVRWLYRVLPVLALVVIAMITIAAIPHPETKELWGTGALEKSRVCLECHEQEARSLQNSAHTFSNQEGFSGDNGLGCIGCHEGWENHLDDPSTENIATPSEYGMSDQASLCSRCHVNQHQIAMNSTDPHGAAGLGCTSCHTVHGNLNVKLLKENGEIFCSGCHTSVLSEFRRRSSHPLEAGLLSCLSCHAMGSVDDPLRTQGHTELCQNCHGDKSGPFLHEHPATQSHGTDGGSCMECHEPHGSPNDRLLTAPGKTLCLQCHAVPPLHRTQHSGMGMKMACVDCHSEIHGSQTNQRMLDPQLETKFLGGNCYQSGCHDLAAPGY